MSDDVGPEWKLLDELPPGQWIAPNPGFAWYADGTPITFEQYAADLPGSSVW